ncbi:unnamed protein product [Paramecium pentaurelia]|uniref:Uncharacterized protein n=1 Tax=Paramecium pentaurelia TaxID=43138 RepID=A0A8S1X5Q8_9CILI|nr:unnamed protein product [Paramecium pentaurelia]
MIESIYFFWCLNQNLLKQLIQDFGHWQTFQEIIYNLEIQFIIDSQYFQIIQQSENKQLQSLL